METGSGKPSPLIAAINDDDRADFAICLSSGPMVGCMIPVKGASSISEGERVLVEQKKEIQR